MKSIRFAKVEDVSRILDIYEPYVKNSVVTFEYEVPTYQVFEKRMYDIQTWYPFIVCEIQGVVVGYAYAHRHMERAAYQWNVELSVYVCGDYKKRAIGKALYTALLDMLKLQNVRNVYSCITIPNPASIALHTSFGFQEIGIFRKTGYKFDTWHDIVWLGKVLHEDEGAPKPITSIHEVKVSDLDALLHRAENIIC